MIVYQNDKKSFLRDVTDYSIEDIIQKKVYERLGIHVKTGESEYNSWKNSLKEMHLVMSDEGIPTDAGVAIEYRIPQTAKRIDFIVTGRDEHDVEQAMLIELKQWTEVTPTDMDGVVITRFHGHPTPTSHPSYQAWSYSALLNDYNQTVYDEKISLVPCAYLHNYVDDGNITDQRYGEWISKAPLFFKNDKAKLKEFIKKYVKHGDNKDTMFRIDSGRIRPSKSLADGLAGMLQGKQEFVMIDDQEIVFEKALQMATESQKGRKKVLIVEGGPGTGKSVVAINLLSTLTSKEFVVQYVTRNSAPRLVYEGILTGHFRRSRISNLFSGSGSFTNSDRNEIDALIIDEAMRLTEKSGMFKKGFHQVLELIRAAKFSVFFIDEDQRVLWDDVGSVKLIEQFAKQEGADVERLSLTSQFRCNGSDGYLAWLDQSLGIRPTANYSLDLSNYDFKIFSSPAELRDAIFEKNSDHQKARLVAGYCWDWVSKKDPKQKDIVFPEFDFAMKWNLTLDWIGRKDSVNEVGCIFTSQGLETQYIGVIVGNDLVVRNGEIVTNPAARAKTDKSSLNGYKKARMTDKDAADKKADHLIRNTYRTLMTRGMKGCYVYFVDKETEEYFRKKLDNTIV